MTLFRWLALSASTRFSLIALALFMALAVACARGLPEAESEAAQLYTRYCSGSGCHDAIPPGGSSYPYWQNQYARMLGIMAEAGWELPKPQEERQIMDYLQRHARGSQR